MEGTKAVLGLRMAGAEGVKFWLHVITELKYRGVEDFLIACCDGLKGFPEAFEAVAEGTLVAPVVRLLVRPPQHLRGPRLHDLRCC